MDRPIVSYDDFTAWTAPEQPRNDDRSEDGRSAKRARWTKWDGGGGPSIARRRAHPHWDEPEEPQPVVSYGADNLVHPASPTPFSTDDLNGNGVSPVQSAAPSIQQPYLPTVKPKKRGKKPKNKAPRTISLTDPGAWDDRALMDAWNAANEEYERMHGPGQKWKNEPVHKASLWYAETKIAPQEDQVNGADGDVQVDFNEETGEGSTHDEDADPDLAHPYNRNEEEAEVQREISGHQLLFPTTSSNSTVPVPKIDLTKTVAPIPPLGALLPNTHTSQAAFEQALNASYWLGYWSAIHAQQLTASSTTREDGGVQN